jgi:DNA-binding Lrp family transcriptional regulator
MNGKKVIVRPGAPALDKGLDLIEALAAESGGLSQKQIAERVGRSVGEIFRMLGVLEQRGYVSRDPVTVEYTLTLQLFRVAAQFPPHQAPSAGRPPRDGGIDVANRIVLPPRRFERKAVHGDRPDGPRAAVKPKYARYGWSDSPHEPGVGDTRACMTSAPRSGAVAISNHQLFSI